MADQNTTDPNDPLVPVQGATGSTSNTSSTTSGSNSSSSSTVMSPADKAQIDAAESNAKGAADLTGQAGDAEAIKQARIADIQDEDADLARQEAADAAVRHQDYLDRVEAARGKQAEAEEALKGHKYENLWHRTSTAGKIAGVLGNIFTGLSGNAAASQAQLQAVQNLAKEDFDKQRQEYAEKLQRAHDAGENVDKLYSQWHAEMGLSKMKEAKAHEAIAAKVLSEGTRLGIPVDQLKTNALVKGMYGTAAQRKLEALQHYDVHNQVEKSRNSTTGTTTTAATGAKGPTPQQLENDAALADALPDAEELIKNPLTPDEMRYLTGYVLNPSKEKGVVGSALNSLGEWWDRPDNAESKKRVETAARLVGRINPMVGEKKTPDSDVAVAMSRLPTTKDVDTSKADRLRQTLRNQAYRTSNPAAFARAATPAPAPNPLQADPKLVARAEAAMNDPNASPAAKAAAAKILGK